VGLLINVLLVWTYAVRFVSVDFLEEAKLLLEVVLLQLGVSHCHADAALREARGMDVEVAQDVLDRTEDVSVALQFDDDDVARVAVQTRIKVVETHVEVDGETFRLSFVHQRDAVEVVLHDRVHIL